MGAIADTGKRLAVVAAGLAVAAVGLASCGDDEADALSKEDLIEQADAICQETNDELDPLWDEWWTSFEEVDVDDPANQDLVFTSFDTLMDELVPVWEEQVDQLRDLAPPEADEQLIEDLLDDLDAAVDEMDEIIDAAAEGDPAARAKLDNDEDPMTDVDARAREYGMLVCGSGE